MDFLLKFTQEKLLYLFLPLFFEKSYFTFKLTFGFNFGVMWYILPSIYPLAIQTKLEGNCDFSSNNNIWARFCDSNRVFYTFNDHPS